MKFSDVIIDDSSSDDEPVAENSIEVLDISSDKEPKQKRKRRFPPNWSTLNDRVKGMFTEYTLSGSSLDKLYVGTGADDYEVREVRIASETKCTCLSFIGKEKRMKDPGANIITKNCKHVIFAMRILL